MKPAKKNRDDERIRPLLDTAPPDGKISIKREWIRPFSKWAIQIVLGILIILIIWSVISWWFNEYSGRSFIDFPAPMETFAHLISLLQGRNMFGTDIYYHISASLGRLTIGYGLAAAAGIMIGLALGYFKEFYPIGTVPVNIIQMIPGLAWIPVALLLFGLGTASAIFIICMTAVAPIAINTAAGIRNVPSVNMKVAHMVKASKGSVISNILIPNSTLDVVNGLRIGFAGAWRVLIAAEMVVGVAVGLGYSIHQSRYVIDFQTAFACIVVIAIIGLIVEKFVFYPIERHVRRKMGMESGGS
ncbi:MAG: ABC transporter permease [Methanomassiliicoccaceae archaeon]|nr:ABC transporter permease [Methanomassiliicoccaceae archaeon]